MTCTDLNGYARDLLDEHNIHLMGGMELTIQALGHAFGWLAGRGTVRPLAGRPPVAPALTGRSGLAAGAAAGGAVAGSATAWTEAQARELLSAAGIPVVPGRVARSAGEAVAIARELGGPVALKISSAAVSHKSDIGGVLLGLSGDDAVRDGYARVIAAAAPHGGGAEVLVTAMRSGGVEVLAGVTVDAGFGPVLAVGLGGIWVELLRDTSLRLLPAGADEVRRMFGELRARPLLEGARGGSRADLDALAKIIAAVGELAASVPGLRALEVNPLWVSGDQIEALDVLVVADPAAGFVHESDQVDENGAG
jgi:succinyl-CoA synthetase beta subunit